MDVQTLLTLLVETISIGFTALLITDFVLGLPVTNRTVSIHRPIRRQYVYGAMMLSQQGQEATQNQIQVLEDVPETSTQTPLEEAPSGWSVVEQVSCYTEFSIRELKKTASKRHIKGYSNLVKAHLIEALLAS